MISSRVGPGGLAQAVPIQDAPRGESSRPTQSHVHSGDGCCEGPLDDKYFIQEDFRGDLEGDNCLTLELFAGESCGVRACLWRELDMKTDLLRDPSSASQKNSAFNSSIIGFSPSVTQEIVDVAVASCCKQNKKIATEDFIQFGVSPTSTNELLQLIDPVELLVIDAMNLQYPSYYKCQTSSVTNEGSTVLIELGTCTRSAANIPPVINTTDALALLIAHWISVAEMVISRQQTDQQTNETQQKKKSKGAKVKPSLNFVLPNSFNSYSRKKIIQAAQIAGGNVKNVYSRGLAAVAGALFRNKGETPSALYAGLSQNSEVKKIGPHMSPLVLNQSSAAEQSAPSPATGRGKVPARPAALNTSQSSGGKVKKNLSTNSAAIVLYLEVNQTFVELSLISCEGSGVDKKGVNLMGFDRLVSVARTSFQVNEPEERWVSGVIVELVMDILRRAEVDKEEITGLLYHCSESTIDELYRFLEDPSHSGSSAAPGKAHGDVGMPLSPSASVSSSPKNSPMRRGKAGGGAIVAEAKLTANDVVRGGCVLAAAELQSSKLFVHDAFDNTFNVNHYFSIGEDDTGGVFGVVIEEDLPPEEAEEGNAHRRRTSSSGKVVTNAPPDEKPKEIFPQHRRLVKPNVGPVLKQALASKSEFKKSFKYRKSKLLYRENSSDPYSLTGGARIKVMQQEPVCPHVSGTGVHTRWRLIEDISPLTGTSSAGGKALVANSDVHITMNSSSGCVEVNVTRGEALVDSKKAIWSIVQFIAFLLFLVALYVSFKMYGIYEENRKRQVLIDWLTNFYKHNAPEKLADPSFVEKTADKYAEKAFVLWRQLLKTYKVKWDPPSIILDESSSDL